MSQDPETQSLFKRLESLIKTKGSLRITHNESGEGMAYYFCATVGDAWPFCHGSTAECAIKNLLAEHLRLKREALQKSIREIDESANL